MCDFLCTAESARRLKNRIFFRGAEIKQLDERVKRNRKRFPEDFMFQLTPEEKDEGSQISDHLAKLKFSQALPYAFTEQGYR